MDGPHLSLLTVPQEPGHSAWLLLARNAHPGTFALARLHLKCTSVSEAPTICSTTRSHAQLARLATCAKPKLELPALLTSTPTLDGVTADLHQKVTTSQQATTLNNTLVLLAPMLLWAPVILA